MHLNKPQCSEVGGLLRTHICGTEAVGKLFNGLEIFKFRIKPVPPLDETVSHLDSEQTVLSTYCNSCSPTEDFHFIFVSTLWFNKQMPTSLQRQTRWIITGLPQLDIIRFCRLLYCRDFLVSSHY